MYLLRRLHRATYNRFASLLQKLGLATHFYLSGVDERLAANGRELSILLLCKGNVCRSPYAAARLRKILAENKRSDIKVFSAGTNTDTGKPVDATTEECAKTRGLDLSEARTLSVNEELLEKADLILIMDSEQRKFLGRFSHTALRKTYYLAAFSLSKGAELIIADPFEKPADIYQDTFSKIDRSLEEFSRLLEKQS